MQLLPTLKKFEGVESQADFDATVGEAMGMFRGLMGGMGGGGGGMPGGGFGR